MQICVPATSFSQTCVCRSRKLRKLEGAVALRPVPSISCCKTRPRTKCVSGGRLENAWTVDAAIGPGGLATVGGRNACHLHIHHQRLYPQCGLSEEGIGVRQLRVARYVHPPKVPRASRISSSAVGYQVAHPWVVNIIGFENDQKQWTAMISSWNKYEIEHKLHTRQRRPSDDYTWNSWKTVSVTHLKLLNI